MRQNRPRIDLALLLEWRKGKKRHKLTALYCTLSKLRENNEYKKPSEVLQKKLPF